MLEMWLSQVFAVDKWYFDKDSLEKKYFTAKKKDPSRKKKKTFCKRNSQGWLTFEIETTTYIYVCFQYLMFLISRIHEKNITNSFESFYSNNWLIENSFVLDHILLSVLIIN